MKLGSNSANFYDTMYETLQTGKWALTVHHTDVSYTIETPKPFPIEARVKAHIAAVETLTKALKAGIIHSAA